MTKSPPFTLMITDDNVVAVDLSDEFAGLPIEEQLKVIEAFFWEKQLEPEGVMDVNVEALKREYTILLAESIMAQLKKGVPLKKGGTIEFSLENLSTLENILT